MDVVGRKEYSSGMMVKCFSIRKKSSTMSKVPVQRVSFGNTVTRCVGSRKRALFFSVRI